MVLKMCTGLIQSKTIKQAIKIRLVLTKVPPKSNARLLIVPLNTMSEVNGNITIWKKPLKTNPKLILICDA